MTASCWVLEAAIATKEPPKVYMGHNQSIHVQKLEVMDFINAQEESG